MMKLRGHELTQRVVAQPDDDKAVNALLNELFGGYPVTTLRPLLHSDDERVVKAAAWLVSELGERAAPLIDELPSLLDHPLKHARFFALDSVLLTAGPDHGRLVAKAISLIADADEAVRWKAMHFLARASLRQLAAGLRDVDEGEIAERTRWLLSLEESETAELEAGLTSHDALTRRFAVAAAARRSERDLGPLELAAGEADSEIRTFAQEWLDVLAARGRR